MARNETPREAAPSDVVEEKGTTPQFVEWTGDPVTGASAAPFEERVLTRKDLKDAYGVELPEGTARLVWNAANRHRVPAADLPAEVLEVLTQQETGFRLTDKR